MAGRTLTSTTQPYSGLAFSFAEMRNEINSIAHLMDTFMTLESKTIVLPNWRQNLQNIQKSSSTNIARWQIPEEQPLRTNLTKGTYETKDKKGLNVYGTLSTIWEIQIDGKGAKQFILTGIASTVIRIFQHIENNDIELASWHFDMGDAQSPGCHFHIQILGDKGNVAMEELFPVPRFPSFLITPMDGLEFLIGELFQNDWIKRVSQEDSPKQTWAACQRKRFTNLLDWKREAIKGNGTPWIAYKLKKPNQDLFLVDPKY